MKVTLQDKNGKDYDKFLTKGCGVVCESKYGIQDVICPKCIRFIWHVECFGKSI